MVCVPCGFNNPSFITPLWNHTVFFIADSFMLLFKFSHLAWSWNCRYFISGSFTTLDNRYGPGHLYRYYQLRNTHLQYIDTSKLACMVTDGTPPIMGKQGICQSYQKVWTFPSIHALALLNSQWKSRQSFELRSWNFRTIKSDC